MKSIKLNIDKALKDLTGKDLTEEVPYDTQPDPKDKSNVWAKQWVSPDGVNYIQAFHKKSKITLRGALYAAIRRDKENASNSMSDDALCGKILVKMALATKNQEVEFDQEEINLIKKKAHSHFRSDPLYTIQINLLLDGENVDFAEISDDEDDLKTSAATGEETENNDFQKA